MIYFTSDTHFCHTKEFLFTPRGFTNVEDMNLTIVVNWNDIVQPDDDVYHLGDFVMNDIDAGIELIKQLNGRIHLIRGNHDTDAKVQRYLECPNIVEIKWADMIKYKKNYFFLSHFPMIPKTPEDEPSKQDMYNLHGHTHQQDSIKDNFFIYHVGMDSHCCRPVSIDEVWEEIKAARRSYYENVEDN